MLVFTFATSIPAIAAMSCYERSQMSMALPSICRCSDSASPPDIIPRAPSAKISHCLKHAFVVEDCGVFSKELWIFKVFVHWCPHCQQLMPRLYKLALILRQRGVRAVRFGAVNCATEHELCAAQNWPGHPLLVARYLGPDRLGKLWRAQMRSPLTLLIVGISPYRHHCFRIWNSCNLPWTGLCTMP